MITEKEEDLDKSIKKEKQKQIEMIRVTTAIVSTTDGSYYCS